jgi:hypothetical protein
MCVTPITGGVIASSALRSLDRGESGSGFYNTMIYKPEVVVIVLILMLPLPQAVWIICFLLAVFVIDLVRSQRMPLFEHYCSSCLKGWNSSTFHDKCNDCKLTTRGIPDKDYGRDEPDEVYEDYDRENYRN